MKNTITLPGLIDPHVHLRDPGQTHKEDFYSGTSAALAGGFTTVLDMPNNREPVTTLERLNSKIASARKQIVCDVGFYFGSLGNNLAEFSKVIDKVKGLKIYLNVTTGNYIIDKGKLLDIYKAWPADTPILLHAEEDVSELVWDVLRITRKPTHVCHISSRSELEFVIRAKDAGLPITCGVTPHHLFLDSKGSQRLGPFGYVKPSIKSKKDQDFLWQHLGYIDIIESDHAPHTIVEKETNPPPFGLPGLETTLPLLLKAEAENRITREQIINWTFRNPSRIFCIDPQNDTAVDIEFGDFTIRNKALKTKAGWTPFDGWKVSCKISKVVLRGHTVYENGQVAATPGSGKLLA